LKGCPALNLVEKVQGGISLMVGRVMQAKVRSVIVSIMLSVLLGIGMSHSGGSALAAGTQQVGLPDRVSVVIGLLTAVNNGDSDGAAALFASNAIFIGALRGGNCSQSTPCTDAAAIHQQLQSVVSAHTCFVLRSVSVSGAVVTGQLETHADNARSNGVDHILQDFTALVPAGQLTFFANLSDVADPQTALNVAINAGTQTAGTPIPTPPTPCGF
jgi:hypothetical protein